MVARWRTKCRVGDVTSRLGKEKLERHWVRQTEGENMVLNKTAPLLLFCIASFLCVDFSLRVTLFYSTAIECGLNNAEYIWFFPAIPIVFMLPFVLPVALVLGIACFLFVREARCHESWLAVFFVLWLMNGTEMIFWIYGLGATPLPVFHFALCSLLNTAVSFLVFWMLGVIKRPKIDG